MLILIFILSEIDSIFEINIFQGEVRISKMDYTSDSARRYGPMPRWHHVECFLKLRDQLQYYEAAKDLPGFYALPADVQDELKSQITAMYDIVVHL